MKILGQDAAHTHTHKHTHTHTVRKLTTYNVTVVGTKQEN